MDRVFSVITKSGVSCPTVMCDIFFSLREAAAKRFQGECSWASCGEASRPQRTHRSRGLGLQPLLLGGVSHQHGGLPVCTPSSHLPRLHSPVYTRPWGSQAPALPGES